MARITYRTQRNYENLQKAVFDGAGPYDIPQLEAIRPEFLYSTKGFIGYNYVKTCKRPESCGVHFFVDDYQFTRLWAQPDKYINQLQRFRVVCTPDFSTYTDYPKALQIYNHYRKHWLGAYWQMHGIEVIPTISWSDESSFEWCFDGEPVGGVVAISSVGTQADSEARRLFMAGYDEMMKRLRPSLILFSGAIPKECKGNLYEISTFSQDLKQRLKRNRKDDK